MKMLLHWASGDSPLSPQPGFISTWRPLATRPMTVYHPAPWENPIMCLWFYSNIALLANGWILLITKFSYFKVRERHFLYFLLEVWSINIVLICSASVILWFRSWYQMYLIIPDERGHGGGYNPRPGSIRVPGIIWRGPGKYGINNGVFAFS